MRLKSLNLLIGTAFLLLLSSSVWATILFVPGDASDPSTAISIAAVGDTVILEEGTYYGMFVLNKEIVLGSRFILDGDQAHIENTILDRGSIFGQTTLTIGGGVGHACVVSGLTVTGGENHSMSILNAGGAIEVDYCDPILDHLLILDNDAEYGAGIGTEYASPIIQHCKFWNNQASIRGGAMACLYGNPTIYGCEFYGNASSYDGASIYLHGTVAEIAHCTFVNNSISVWGSGKGVYCWSTATAFIHNSIFWNGGGSEIGVNTAYPSTWATVGNCDVAGGSTSISSANVTIDGPILNADPGFVLGAHTTFGLSASSPAIDAGDGALGTSLDADVDLNIVNGAAPDLGAYEYGTTTFCADPSGLNSAVSTSAVGLSWSSVAGADGYQVEGWKQTTPALTKKVVSGTSGFTIPVSALESGADYEWRVRARCQPGAAISGWSEIKDFTAPEEPLLKMAAAVGTIYPSYAVSGSAVTLTDMQPGTVWIQWHNILGQQIAVDKRTSMDFNDVHSIPVPESKYDGVLILTIINDGLTQSWKLP